LRPHVARPGLIDIELDSQDQRKQFIALTPKGVALHGCIVELALAREQALLEGLSASERMTLLRLLIHLEKRLPAANSVGGTRRRIRKASPC
jgi:DNA-binding MarR family transcriptional regulator